MGKNTVEAKQWLDKRYGDSAPGKLTIIDWYVLGDCQLKLCEIADTLRWLYRDSVSHIRA